MLHELRQAIEKLDEVLILFSEPGPDEQEANRFYWSLERRISDAKEILNSELYRREREILSNLTK